MWFKRNLPTMILVLIMLLVSYVRYAALPDSLPSHFSLDGMPDAYMPKNVMVILFPGILLGALVFSNVMVRMSPKRYSMPNSRNTLDQIILGCAMLFMGIHLATMLAPGPLAPDTLPTRFAVSGIAAFLILAGNMLAKSERNFFVGLRLPWTLASIENWTATHRLAGKLMVGCGMVLLLALPFYARVSAATIGILLSVGLPCLYSFAYYLIREKPRESKDDN